MKATIFNVLVLAVVLLSGCQKSQESEKEPPIFGEWKGEKFYNVKGNDTLSVKENSERFYVSESGIRYSYFGEENGEMIPYSIVNDTITMNGVAFFIVELNENSLVRSHMFSDSTYQIFVCKKVK